MPIEDEAKPGDKYRRWVKDVYEPWYAAAMADSGNNGPPPPPPEIGG